MFKFLKMFLTSEPLSLTPEQDPVYSFKKEDSQVVFSDDLADVLKNGSKLCINFDGVIKMIDLKNNTVTEKEYKNEA